MNYINTPQTGIKYRKRVGVYGLVVNQRLEIAVVKTSTGYFLPGGGVEENESFIECLKRECQEEIAFDVCVGKYLSAYTYYFYSTTLDYPMESIGYFYECVDYTPLDKPSEKDHALIWMTLKDAADALYLKNQQAAVVEYQGSL